MKMENNSLKSTNELRKELNAMRKWKKPSHEQLMVYLSVYSELEIRGNT